MRKIDEKYQTTGDITKLDGTPIPEDEPLILFRAHDKLLLPLLEDYMKLCIDSGSPEKHLGLLKQRIDAIKAWQETNTEKLKVPGSNL
ncbi:MAG: hypothetical protein ABIQ89_01875 [Candidatus Saccharimonadales bacterium]